MRQATPQKNNCQHHVCGNRFVKQAGRCRWQATSGAAKRPTSLPNLPHTEAAARVAAAPRSTPRSQHAQLTRDSLAELTKCGETAAQSRSTCGAALPKHPRFARCAFAKTVWPSGLRRWLKAPVRKGVGSNPTAVICRNMLEMLRSCWHHGRSAYPSRSRPASSQLRRSSSCCDGFVCHRGGSRRRQ